MALLSEITGLRGVFEVLRSLDTAPARGVPEHTLYGIAALDGPVEVGEGLVEQLIGSGLVRREGHQFRLTVFGARTYLLLEAMNGGDVTNVFNRLTKLGQVAPMYELVRQGMAERFLETLVTRPGFRRLYIASPWINLSRRARGFLLHAVHQCERKHGEAPELLVITRPQRPGDRGVPEAVKPLEDLGATVFLHGRLHSKLYIREPDSTGGVLLATVGSENLTRSVNLELGIQINYDSRLINQLIRYFWDISTYSTEP